MTMTNLSDLAQFAKLPFQAGYPTEDHIVLQAPDDDILAATAFFVDSAKHSLALALPAFEHPGLETAILRKLQDSEVYVHLYMRDSAFNGKKSLFLNYAEHNADNEVTINYEPGEETLICGTADGLDSFTGSGACLTFARHPMIAFRTRLLIDLATNAARQRGQ